MSRDVRRALFTLALLAPLSVASSASATGWTQAEGRCYAKVWARAIIGSGAYESTGLRDDRQDVVDYQDVQASLYAECGLHPQVTALVFGAPFGFANAGRSTAYMGPLGVGVRFDPIGDGGSTRFALQANYSYAPPVGDDILFEEAGAAPRIFYRPALENHYGELTVQLGQGFAVADDINGWFAGYAGARLNSGEGMDPAIVASLQVGMTFGGWFTAEVHFPFYEPFGQDVVETNIAGVGQTRYLGFGFGLSFWVIPELSINVGLDGVFYASSNAATPSLFLGLESRFQAWGGEE